MSDSLVIKTCVHCDWYEKEYCRCERKGEDRYPDDEPCKDFIEETDE